MKALWKLVNSFRISSDAKARLFLGTGCALLAIFGITIWLIFRIFFLQELYWAFGFAGWGAFVGFLCSTWYIFNHEFEDVRKQELEERKKMLKKNREERRKRKLYDERLKYDEQLES